MAKVQIYRNDDARKLENDINRFIDDKELIDIKIETNLVKELTGTSIYTTAVIIYEDHNPLAHPERYLDDTMAIVDDMTMAQRKELLKYLENVIEGNRR